MREKAMLDMTKSINAATYQTYSRICKYIARCELDPNQKPKK